MRKEERTEKGGMQDAGNLPGPKKRKIRQKVLPLPLSQALQGLGGGHACPVPRDCSFLLKLAI